MLPHAFFPTAHFYVWADAKLQLRISAHEAVERFLVAPRAELAALRNLRRASEADPTVVEEWGFAG